MTGPSVVVVGAGLSGLTCALRLRQAGVDDVLVLDARDRPGGRIDRIGRDGHHLEAGAEFVDGPCPRLMSLASELGISRLAEPARSRDAQLVRIDDCGDAIREIEPFASVPETHAAIARGLEALVELAADVDASAPWAAPRARELDAHTLHSWINASVEDRLARRAVAARFAASGGHAEETSLLHALWTIASYGHRSWLEESGCRLDGGPSTLVERLLEELRPQLALSEPVRALTRGAKSVRVRTDRREIAAEAVVLALSPTLAARIDFTPGLPVLRDRLNHRWLQGHGAKFFAIYDHQWWKEDCLSGDALGREPFPVIVNVSRSDVTEGVLLGLVFAGAWHLPEHAALLDDHRRSEQAFVDLLELCFGPRARAVTEVHSRRWFGDTWSHGCGSGTPPGVLSSVGSAIREPVHRILWAGAETAPKDHLEGAVDSGERAAAEALPLLG